MLKNETMGIQTIVMDVIVAASLKKDGLDL